MNVKKHLFALGLVAVMASPALAAEDILPPNADSPFSITGSAALTTEYFFRGISQSNDSPSVSAGLNGNYKFNDMFTATVGLWSASVDSATANGDVELDWIAGLAITPMDNLTANLGYTYYSYPGSNNNNGNGATTANEPDFQEVSAALSYNWFDGLFSTTGMYAYSPDFNLNSGKGQYINGKVVVPIKYIDLSAAIGKQYVQKNATWGNKDIVDYKFAAAAKVWGLDLELAYIDTNTNKAFPSGITQASDGTFIFTVTKNF